MVVGFGRSPLGGGGIDQQKFQQRAAQTVTNGSNLHRLLDPGWLAGRVYSRANRWLPEHPEKWQKQLHHFCCTHDSAYCLHCTSIFANYSLTLKQLLTF